MPMNYRQAAKLIRKHGGGFLRHGRNHDVYLSAEGVEIEVPRHPGDFTIGVEKDIKRKLGLK